MAGSTDGDSFGEGIPIDRLLTEIDADGESDLDGAVDFHEGSSGEAALATTMNLLFPNTDFRFDEEVVKTMLEELLVVLVALQEEETHGKRLMGDLARMFDARLSPGTVYPKLHDLEEAGVIHGHEKVHTRDYLVDDYEAARERVETTMRQHLALSVFLYVALQRF